MNSIQQIGIFDQQDGENQPVDAAASMLLEGLKYANQITNPESRCDQIARIICNRAPVHQFVMMCGIEYISTSTAPLHIKTKYVSRIYAAHGIGTPQAIGQGEKVVPESAQAIADVPEPITTVTTNDTNPTPADERSVEPLQADHGQVWYDPEMQRWAYALNLSPAYMLSRLAIQLKENNYVELDKLIAAAPYSPSYTYELLALDSVSAGDSPFYSSRAGNRLYFRGETHVAERLALLLVEKELHAVLDGRRPGIRKRCIAVDADQSALYSAWLESKRTRRISRQTLSQLWNVSEQTVIRWDKAAGIEAQRNYAQTTDLRDERVPAEREDYMVAQQDGQLIAMYQQANTYHPTQTTPEHPHKGQARKVRKAISAVLSTEQPSKNLVEAHPFRTQHFAGGSDPLKAWKDYQAALKNKPFARVTDYLYRGQRQRARALHRPAIWELMAHRPGQDCPRTTANQYLRVN